MNLISGPFILFVLAVLLLYYAVPRKSQNVLLVAASYLFYFSISLWFPLILIVVTVVTWLIAMQLFLKRQHRKTFFILALVFNLAILVVFKVHHFFVPQILSRLDMFGWQDQTLGLHILIPVGMSFYILQAISFVVDCYQGRLASFPGLMDFSLYLAYFPKLTAGPIERPGSFLPKLLKARTVDNEKIAKAFALLLIGLVRKIVVADPLLAAVPAGLFQDPGAYTAVQLISMTLLFGLGLYFDFSGYTDIVRGISGFFGIELSPNFRWPLFSKGISDFWNRWHISLSHWLRDNIFYPLTRMFLKKNIRSDNWKAVFIPPVVTMALSGFWHGTRAHFLVWGLIMGLLLAVERLWRVKVNPVRRIVPGTLRNMGSIVFTMGLIFACSIPFMVPLAKIVPYMKGVSKLNGLHAANFRIFVFLVPGLLIDLIQFRANDELVFMKWHSSFQAAAIAFAVLAVLFMSQVYVPGAFLYQGF